jgi:hypothetical protein
MKQRKTKKSQQKLTEPRKSRREKILKKKQLLEKSRFTQRKKTRQQPLAPRERKRTKRRR